MATPRGIFTLLSTIRAPKQLSRKFHTLDITQNISFHSHNEKFLNPQTLKVYEIEEKPLVVLLPWLIPKKRHVRKFLTYYIGNRFDVVEARLTPWQVLFPRAGSHLVAADLLKFLKSNTTYGPLLLHGFSVGSYLWGEVLVKMGSESVTSDFLVKKIVGQIWDSAVPLQQAGNGIAQTIFPDNAVLQNALKSYIKMHMKVFNDISTCYHVKSSEMFHHNMIKAPAKFFVSKKDPIGCAERNRLLKETWSDNGVEVFYKCWDDSPHVQHFHYHPTEYIDELNEFLARLDLLPDSGELALYHESRKHYKPT